MQFLEDVSLDLIKIQDAVSESRRSKDSNNYLTVTDCILSKATVSPYRGADLLRDSTLADFGINPQEIYYVYRPEEELQKAVDSFKMVPVYNEHPNSPNEPTIGTVGENVHLSNGKLVGNLKLWAQDAVKLVETNNKKGLSCGYVSNIIPDSGEYEGQPYQFRMQNIRGNHLAVVAHPRVADAIIVDGISNNLFNKSTMPTPNKNLHDIPNEQITKEVTMRDSSPDEALTALVQNILEQLNIDATNDYYKAMVASTKGIIKEFLTNWGTKEEDMDTQAAPEQGADDTTTGENATMEDSKQITLSKADIDKLITDAKTQAISEAVGKVRQEMQEKEQALNTFEAIYGKIARDGFINDSAEDIYTKILIRDGTLSENNLKEYNLATKKAVCAIIRDKKSPPLTQQHIIDSRVSTRDSNADNLNWALNLRG